MDVAKRRVNQFFSACRTNGKWTEHSVNDQRIFFNRDQNGHQRAVGIAAKRLHVEMLKIFSNQKLFVDRQSGTVSRSGWRNLVKVDVSKSEELVCEIKNKNIEDLERDTDTKLDRDKLVQDVRAAVVRRDTEEWTCL